MTTLIIFLILSVGLSGLFTFLICRVTGPWMAWISVLFIPVIFVILTFLSIVFVAIYSRITTSKKRYVLKPNRFIIALMHELDFCLMVMLNVSWRVKGYYKIPKKGKFALICNHRSNFDQMILISALKQKNQPLVCISKPSNFKMPLAGPIIRKAGYIPINRENAVEGVKSIYHGADLLKNQVANVNICPEGTRNKDKNVDLLPFHQGSFKLATLAKVPIVVVCLKKTDEIHKRTPIRHTRVDVDVLETIYPEQYEGMSDKELCDYVYSLIKDDYHQENKFLL